MARFIVFLFLLCCLSVQARAEMITFQSPLDWKKIRNENYERMGNALMKGDYATLDAYYNGKQKAYENGEIDEYILGWEFEIFEDVFKHPPSHAYLEKWVQASPNSYAANLVMGLLHLDYGFAFRGTKWASQTTPEQFAGMKREYEQAAPYLLQSLTLADKPVLSYEAILTTFKNADVAMAAFAPKPDQKQQRDITVGEAFAGSLQELAKSLGVPAETPHYTYEELHRAMWYYARQGFAVAPNSRIIADAYFDLIKPKWYGSEDMMIAFAEKMYEGKVIDKKRYQEMRYTIPWERGLWLGDESNKNFNAKQAANLFLEAASYVDESDPGYYYHALAHYLLMADWLYQHKELPDAEIAGVKAKLTAFLQSTNNPFLNERPNSTEKHMDKINELKAALGG